MSFATYTRAPGDPVGIVTLNRPERLNAISGSLLADLQAAISEGMTDDEAAALVMRGEGRAFCAGDDLKEFDLQTQNASSIQAHIRSIQQITRLMMGGDKPIVGAVHGFAVGGGFEWLLNCDIVVASDDLIAFFPEMDWGQFVTGGVTHLLPLAVGHQRSMELLLLGERQTAQGLKGLGLVNRVVAREAVLPEAVDLARRIAGKARFSVSRLKRLVNLDLAVGLWRALDLEENVAIQSFGQPEAAERVKRFAQRRAG